MSDYRICTRCIMDSSDKFIVFDESGVCNHCHKFDNVLKKNWFPNEQGRLKLEVLAQKIKKDGKGKEFDSVMGLSGGVDSSYVAYQAKKLGLRPLAIHVDCGWNSELAVKNIENIVNKLGFELYTHVVDWAEMRDLQSAFLEAGVPNLDIPQDHAIASSVFKMARKHGIRYLLSGSNFATEGILPSSWGYTHLDTYHVKSIHKQFGKLKLKRYPFLPSTLYYWYIRLNFIKRVAFLNYLPYNKNEAIKTLSSELGWRSYGSKHCESLFTAFFQTYYLPHKFGFDKRRAHLSSLIVSDQMTREEALKIMKESVSDEKVEEEKIYFAKKLGYTLDDFEAIMRREPKDHFDYPYSRFKRNLNQFKNRLFGRPVA